MGKRYIYIYIYTHHSNQNILNNLCVKKKPMKNIGNILYLINNIRKFCVVVVGLAYQGKDIVFRFITEYSSLRDFGL